MEQVVVRLRTALALVRADGKRLLSEARDELDDAAATFARSVTGTDNATAKSVQNIFAAIPGQLDEIDVVMARSENALLDYIEALGVGGGPAGQSLDGFTPDITGDREPKYTERAGARIVEGGGAEGPADVQRADKFFGATRKNADKLLSAAKDVTELVQRGMVRPPTGQANSTIPTARPPTASQASAPDAVQGVVVAGAMVVEAVGWGMRRYRRLRKGHDDGKH